MFDQFKRDGLFKQGGLFKQKGLFATPPYQPLGSVVGSCVFDVDATLRASYNGGDCLNAQNLPADLSLPSLYDFEGIGSAKPTFTGSINNPNAYFAFDGGDKFIAKNTLTTFLNSIHKTTGGSDFTFAMIIYYINGNQIFMTNRQAGSNNVGLQIYSLSANNFLRLVQRGSTGTSTDVATAGAITNASWNFIAAGHTHATNTTRLWLNSSTGVSTSNTFNATTATASATKFNVGAYGDSTFPLPNTSRLKGFYGFNKLLSNEEMSLVIASLKRRHVGILGSVV